MAEILSTDFSLDEIPLYSGPHGYSKYADIRQALLNFGKVKLRVQNPEGLNLTGRRRHEGGRIYGSLAYWFNRNDLKQRLRGRLKGEVLWLWLVDRKKEE